MMKQQPPHAAASDGCNGDGTHRALELGGTRLSAVEDDDDNDEEEEMISLKLSPNSANEDGSSSSVVGDCGRKKQTVPATSAASAAVYSQQPHHNSSVEKYGQQAMHRRTPGAGNGHTDVSWYFFCCFLRMRRLIT